MRPKLIWFNIPADLTLLMSRFGRIINPHGALPNLT
jgi:hypothetical protein